LWLLNKRFNTLKLAAISEEYNIEPSNVYNVILYETTDIIQYTETWNSTIAY